MSTEEIDALDRDGIVALPRSNGDLVFEAPWQSRAFGVALALRERDALDFEEFRAALIAAIGEGDDYYEGWQAALERTLVARGVVSNAELQARAAALAHAWAHDHEH